MAEQQSGSSSNNDIDVDLDSVVDLDAPLDKPTEVEKVVSIEEIRAMIGQLAVTENGEPLKGAMQDLKKAIKDNPEACAVLLPEDVGEMVKALYRMTDRDLEKAIEKAQKNKRTTKPKIDLSSKEVQQEVLDDL